MEAFIPREPDEKRQRKRTSLDPVTCPVCGITIRENELDHHFKSELEKLNKIKRIVNKSPSSTPPGSSKSKMGESSSSSKNDTEENCWETYTKIKENRVRRTSKVSLNYLSPTSCILIYLIHRSSKIEKGKLKIDPAPSAPRSSQKIYSCTLSCASKSR